MNVSRKTGFFNNSKNKRLFYSLVLPANYDTVWVFCNPFLEEKTYTQSTYKYFADFLAGNGNAVFRFDYQGDGDSEGILEDVGLEDWCADISDAVQFVESICNTSSISLFGLRLGGTLAWNVASKINITQILLWNPILNGEEYFNQLLRFNLTAQMISYGKVKKDRLALRNRIEDGNSVNILGHEVNKKLANSLYAIQLNEKSIPKCTINIVNSSMSSNPSLQKKLSIFSSTNSIKISMIHARPFWHEPKLIDIRQQKMIDASIELINKKDITGHPE